MIKPLIISLLLFAQVCNAQFVEKINFFISPIKSLSTNTSPKSYKFDQAISSLSVCIKQKYSFDDSYLVAAQDTFYLNKDEHSPAVDKQYSILVIFPKAVNSFELHYADIRDSIDIFLINDNPENSKYFTPTTERDKKINPDFTEPAMIDQSVWRAGLKDPDFERIVHEVHNVIIHHSASSNLVTDYTSAIRNIYLYHTEVRGWSDIGYNYVIAANGDIYKGRDPGIYEQDLVMGAHFCSSNHGTMGICMLGTFTEVAPTDTAFDSLEKILVWKLGKDGLDPLGQCAHPLNDELNVISGHRDGCATECPGEILYSRLGLMRERVNNKIILLGIDLVDQDKNLLDEIHFFPNPFDHCLSITSNQEIESISILNLSGKTIKIFRKPSKEIDLSFLSSGMYLVKIKSGNKTFLKRILKK